MSLRHTTGMTYRTLMQPVVPRSTARHQNRIDRKKCRWKSHPWLEARFPHQPFPFLAMGLQPRTVQFISRGMCRFVTQCFR